MAAKKKKAAKKERKIILPNGEEARLITPEVWQEIAEWYAQHGADHTAAAARFNYARRTLVRLYYEGSKSLQKPPINTLMGDVELQARAIRNKLQDDQLREAQSEMTKLLESMPNPEAGNSLVDAAEARAHEGMMVASGRRNITMYQLLVGKVLEAMAKRIPDMMHALEEDLTPRQLVATLKDLSRGLADTAAASKAIMEQERLLMGQPTALIGVSSSNMDKGKAEQVLALAHKTYLRRQLDAQVPITAKVAAEPELPIPADDDVYEDEDGCQEETPAETSTEEGTDSGSPTADEGEGDVVADGYDALDEAL